MECMFSNTMKLSKSSLCIRPEWLYPVDVVRLQGKFIVAMIDPEMLIITHVNKSVMAVPGVGMDY